MRGPSARAVEGRRACGRLARRASLNVGGQIIPLANALDRWDEEGGAPAVPWPLPYETGDLLDAERRVLECLGTALVSECVPRGQDRRAAEAVGKAPRPNHDSSDAQHRHPSIH
jgi:hypothetical protein